MSKKPGPTSPAGDGGRDSVATRGAFLRYGAVGVAGVAVAGTTATRLSRAPRAQATTSQGVLDLFVNEGFVPMVDGTLVYMRGYGQSPTDITSTAPSLTISPQIFLADGTLVSSRLFPHTAAPPPQGTPQPGGTDPASRTEHLIRHNFWGSFLPRRTIVAVEGATVRLRITNRLHDVHDFVLEGAGISSGPIAPGATKELDFPAPPPGDYIYHDDVNGPVNRVLGMNGVLVVAPADQPWRLYRNGPEFERQWVWLFHAIEPEWGRLTRLGRTVDPSATPAVPRYFTINGRSGVFAVATSLDVASNTATKEDTKPSGFRRRFDVRDFSFRPGQLVRLVNTGLARHQAHFHGNHVRTLTHNNVVLSAARPTPRADGEIDFQMWEDVVQMPPLDTKDVILPLKPPPDVTVPHTCPWMFPMHCHAEMSQTAAGGLYPNGLLTDWVLHP